MAMLELLPSPGFHWMGGSLLLAIAVAVGVPLFVPSAPMALAAGAAWGLASAPWVLIGATAGSAAAAFLTRRLLRARVDRAVARRPLLRALVGAVEQEGWRVIFLLRLGCPVPGALVSYSAGLTGIGLLPFSLATAAGKAGPLTAIVWLGSVGRAALQTPDVSTLQLALAAIGAAATVGVSVVVGRRMRSILRVNSPSKA
jgi:uncharacterized membrane protein YdjX (TVP38/TMEM64 family)